MNKQIFLLIACICTSFNLLGSESAESPVSTRVSIVGGGIVGALESYTAYKDAQKNNEKICITVYEKGEPLTAPPGSDRRNTTNTAFNILPSLTIDEILSVVPRGSDLMNKLAILFSNPGGIRVDDVPGVNDSTVSTNFKEAVMLYDSDKNHEDRINTLLMLGKMSMNLWQEIYEQADDEFKGIMEASNFNPCREPRNASTRVLHDGYRIDLIYGIANAQTRALGMQADYEKMGYKNCKILSADEVVILDPYLADFCHEHTTLDATGKRIWKNDSVALWRPGGCIDTRIFLPKLYGYLQKAMGQYKNSLGEVEDCFNIKFNSEVVSLQLEEEPDSLRIKGLKFSDGSQVLADEQNVDYRYVFCPGEAVGTLQKLGFNEPAFVGFAGPSLMLNIPITQEQTKFYKNFSHCMEVHGEGIVLAWQARIIENNIFIGVAGTKAFYGDKLPNKNEAFAKNRNLVQLNMINNVLPEFISLALKRNTQGKALSEADLTALENAGLAQRWVGRRAVAYDNFPTLGSLYMNNHVVSNARCTTHLGSGGVSFGPAAVTVSRFSEKSTDDAFIKKVLSYADSRRSPKN